ncbi:MAG: hypothetical protein M0Z96_09340 [Actinomycetota bacterium]|nr:hypothetical protein [Actinomycetota bacterium]
MNRQSAISVKKDLFRCGSSRSSTPECLTKESPVELLRGTLLKTPLRHPIMIMCTITLRIVTLYLEVPNSGVRGNSAVKYRAARYLRPRVRGEYRINLVAGVCMAFVSAYYATVYAASANVFVIGPVIVVFKFAAVAFPQLRTIEWLQLTVEIGPFMGH